MRPTSTLIHLSFLAPLVLTSPIPLVLVGDLESASGAAHPPATVPATRPKHALPEVIPFREDEDDETPINNEPITPSDTVSPSVVLATPRPIATSYLLSLAHSWTRKENAAAAKDTPAETVEAVELSTTMRKEVGLEDAGVPVTAGDDAMRRKPCQFYRTGRNNDVLTVSLVVIFVVVVMIMETFTSAKRLFSRQGAIRLETEQRDGKPLSVRSEVVEALNEKPAP